MSRKRKATEEKTALTKSSSTITLTFGDAAENHKGMQVIGEGAQNGFTREDLVQAKQLFEEQKMDCELHDLTSLLPESTEEEKRPEALLLIIRNGVSCLLKESTPNLWIEHSSLPLDTKAFMYGRVVNKKARHNLCFAETSQEPDYQEGKGRVVSFSTLPYTNKLREQFPLFLGSKAKGLVAEGNYYYDVQKCGIGWHGDSERKRVVGVRLGCSLPLYFHWFQNSKPLGKTLELLLNDGDIYVMSEKAVGWDWKRKKVLTLRHSAGCNKFLKL